MRGTVISINANDQSSGRIATYIGELFVYQLPEEINVGEKIKYDTRVSRLGNKYAVYTGRYSREEIQVESIDFERRMTSREYITLYCYDMIMNNKKAVYSDEKYMDWVLTEELIESYNSASEDVKMDVAELSRKQIKLLNNKFVTERWNYEKPVIWKDRKKTPYYINQLTESHRFEVFVDTLFRQHGFDIGLYYGRKQQYSGETQAGIEIKLDKRLKETKNVYIEYQERLRKEGNWVNSGILKEDNTKFILIGDIDKYYILSKKKLLEYYNRLIVNEEIIPGIRCVAEKEHGTSKGYIMSEEIAILENKTVTEAINELMRGQ